nr:immunoglobulin heavy chain junction region [Macaca mulatta]MOW79397.1 immunoglobulin heavy chain junction region [Macaca mulatta]
CAKLDWGDLGRW